YHQVLVHTGQHYDYNMSKVFFEELEMPDPDEFLNVGSGSHAAQTAAVMVAFELVLAKHKPDWVFVVGDVNSTLACALVCAKLCVRVAHIEAGLRSGDRTMPEEINRLLTDQISDLLFTPSKDGNENLSREGIDANKIHFVGNVMIDTLARMLPKAQTRSILTQLGVKPGHHLLATLHRPSNVDDPVVLRGIFEAMLSIATAQPVIFPVHPRTRARLRDLGLDGLSSNLKLIEPLGYLDFLALMSTASLVITDSGGVQEETTFLGIRCLTVRPNTERPITITHGTNRLVGSRSEDLLEAVRASLGDIKPAAGRPELWDGKAADRIAEVMSELS
ncbi:MAG TPA: UDP-N-acetylglucosamine 2-epimerase (non-hydrolyzing), partial [Patescibacteria group bacterium]|nr:UDP-N-acetylglucosamine 2-epimerase (non-hydrolyzing) [Patescibacteria group bacterium]